MKRFAASLVLAAALLGSTLAGTALGQDSDSPQILEEDSNSSRIFDEDFNTPQNFASPQARDSWGNRDRNGYSWGQGRFNRANLEGRWVADDRSANHRSDRGDFRYGRGLRGTLLPDFIRIDQRPTRVRIADVRNRPLQRIMIGGKFDSRYGNRAAFGSDYLSGRWRGHTLVVEHMGRRGATITQTFTLDNRGRSLVVRTFREGRGPRMQSTTVYHRA
jgi:hypothetical protein